jgi:exopolyphosphatase
MPDNQVSKFQGDAHMSGVQGMKRVEEFLQSARGRAKQGVVHVVMGNEAADLDSMASALVYAWYRSETMKPAGEVCLPFIPIPRADFKLRTEAVFLFQEAGLSPDKLLFLEDLDLPALHKEGRLKLVLVDHNKLASAQAGLAEAVEEILDHHQDEKLYPRAASRVIEPVGSSASLVAEKILRDIPRLLEPDCARLLLGTILLDTVNLDPKAGRVTPKDSQMAEKLLALSGAGQKELFDRLQFEKFNVAALDSADLLRKDYKAYTAGKIRYGMSSVLISADAWARKDARLAEELARYAAAGKLGLLVVMIAYTEPEFRRELLVYSPDEKLHKIFLEFLNSKDLDLKPINPESLRASARLALFSQANASYSRKKLQPLLQDFLAGVTL